MGQEKDKKRNNFSKGLWRTYLKIHLFEVVQGTSLLSHLHLHVTKALRFCAVSCPELLHSCIMTTVSPSSTVWLSSRECTTFIATEEPWLSINVSTGLKLHFIQQRKGKCSSPFKPRIPLLKIQMQIYQCRKFKKGVTPICQSRFLCCFPDGSADAVLGLQSQPTESKKGMFQDCRYPNTSESICVWCHKMLTFPAPHMLSAL